MSFSGYYVLHVGERGTAVRLEWTEGQPSITVLDDTQSVRINGTPVEPQICYPIQAGDVIRVGDAQLTWHAEPTSETEVATKVGVGIETETERPLPEPSTSRKEVGAPAAPVYNLVVHTPRWTKELRLKGEVLRIGRAPDSDIYINDSRISRSHAQLVRTERGYEIVDLDSANGLQIGDERTFRKLLADGDVVSIARDISLTYRIVRPEATVADVKGVEAPEEIPPTAAEVGDRTVLAPKPISPPTSPDEKKPGQGEIDKTVVAPKPDTSDATVVAPKPAAASEPPRTSPEEALPPDQTTRDTTDEGLDQTVVVPKSAAPPPSVPSDATVVVPKKGSPAPQKATPGEGRDAPAQTETEWLDVAEILERDPNLKIESGTIVRNTQIPHLVIHLPHRTWEAQFTQERMTLGRDEDNDLTISDASVSRHHAWIERRGRDFVIREDQSRNGVWLGRQRIEEHTLRDGDVLSLGRAKLIFKAGFTSDDLTLIGTPRIDGKPQRRPVVFVPGMMGSELWLGSERLWPNTRLLLSNPEVFSLPGDPRIEARNIVSDVVVVPGVLKQEQYSRLGDYLVAGLRYTRGKDLLEFAYDWRQDVRLAAQRLAETIERWDVQAPVTIIAHSLGTLVTRYYVEKLGGKQQVERIILMGGPHYGAPKAISVILTGPGILPFGVGDERMRNVLSTFPSTYQILPIYPSVTDQDGEYISVLKDDSWLPQRQRPFLRAARSFRRELGFLSSVPTVSIFGYGLKTILRAKIHRRPDGRWGKVDFVEDSAGDLSVPSGSAVLKGSEIHPVLQEHGSLYVDDDVKMRLKVELTRSTTWQRRKGK